MNGIYCSVCRQYMPKKRWPQKRLADLSQCNYCGQQVPQAMRTASYARDWQRQDEHLRDKEAGQRAAV